MERDPGGIVCRSPRAEPQTKVDPEIGPGGPAVGALEISAARGWVQISAARGCVQSGGVDCNVANGRGGSSRSRKMLPKAIHSHHSQPGLNGPAAPPHLVEQREYIYFTSHVGGDWSVYGQGIADRNLERVVSLNGVQEAQDVAALSLVWLSARRLSRQKKSCRKRRLTIHS